MAKLLRDPLDRSKSCEQVDKERGGIWWPRGLCLGHRSAQVCGGRTLAAKTDGLKADLSDELTDKPLGRGGEKNGYRNRTLFLHRHDPATLLNPPCTRGSTTVLCSLKTDRKI